ncbi:MAG TPA: DUF2071 domain-containing protein [Gemmatimonadaceae bacterium]
MPEERRPFLTAEWRDLLLLNYEVSAKLLERHVPRGTELDEWEGRPLVSLVGFRFLGTRVLGVAVPGHGDFDEVNLRFYVRRSVPGGPPRRGVVFIRELVPRRAVAWVARLVYGEPYLRAPMSHRIVRGSGGHPEEIAFDWRARGEAWRLSGRLATPPRPLERPSEAEFVCEHYWGYTSRAGGRTLEYEVKHPAWNVAPVFDAHIDAEGSALYGADLGEVLARAPRSAFYADGSAVSVFRGRAIGG